MARRQRPVAELDNRPHGAMEPNGATQAPADRPVHAGRPVPTGALLQEELSAEAAVRTLLHAIGEDPAREGLVETPARFVKALRELTEGRRHDPARILATTFEEGYAGPVTVRGIPFWSLCEHHLLPFHGTVDVTYEPAGRVVGLSKLSRLVQCFARRLQMQERMTRQVADAIEQHLGAAGVHVVVRGHHTCMAARGVRTPAEMETVDARGSLAGPGRAAGTA